MSQNATIELDAEQQELLQAIHRLDGMIFEKWPAVADYWRLEEAKMLEELQREECAPIRTQFIRGALAMLRDIIDFPALVKKERESLTNPE